MWIAYAVASACFAGLVSILAKAGLQAISSTVATAVRTLVVLAMAVVMVLLVGSEHTLRSLDARSLVFLGLSGIATGASWLCYFRALQLGPVSQVAAIDKSSIVLTMLLAMAVFGETSNLLAKLVGISAITVGTLLMIQWRGRPEDAHFSRAWMLFAVLSAVFASLPATLAKIGFTDVESNLGTALRTVVVLVMAWAMVFVTGEQQQLRRIRRRDLRFLVLSGLATGASWLCYFRALQLGPVTGVVSIDKLSIAVTVLLSVLVFGERVSRRALVGLALIVAGTLAMVL